jgi:molybdopterin-guanine dinucleotide biosynthesis protein A
MSMIPRTDITGLVLAGGRGSRMGGADKGLQLHAGRPLALLALERLRLQVGPLLISANRNAERYAAFGAPVLADDAGLGHAGPLAGWLAGLARCETPFLAAVPCDAPAFPSDLVARLAQALAAADTEIAVAATRDPTHDSTAGVQLQPVFGLLRAGLHDDLAAFLQTGERKVARWTAQHRCAVVVFDDAQAFVNVNTVQQLQQLQPLQQGQAGPGPVAALQDAAAISSSWRR